MILRCNLDRLTDRLRKCGGLIGGAPNGTIQLREVARIEDAAPGNFAMRCERCRRYVEVRPPAYMRDAA